MSQKERKCTAVPPPTGVLTLVVTPPEPLAPTDAPPTGVVTFVATPPEGLAPVQARQPR